MRRELFGLLGESPGLAPTMMPTNSSRDTSSGTGTGRSNRIEPIHH